MRFAKPQDTFSSAVLGFLRRAGAEQSTARLVAEMFRHFGTTSSLHRVSLFLTLEDGELVPWVSELMSGTSDAEQFYEWRRLQVEELPVVQQIRAGEDVILFTDPTEGMPIEIVDKYDLRPYLSVALRRDDLLIGVLIVEADIDVLRERKDEIAEFAEYLAMALANARAFQRERRRTRDAEALLEVGAVLAETTDLIPVLASVARNCARVTGFDRGSVFLLDEEGRLIPTMSQFADGHTDDEAWERFRSTVYDVPVALEVLRTGEPRAFSDIAEAPDLNPEWWIRDFGIRSILYLPLIAWGQSLGVLALDRSRPHRISNHQVRSARGVAAQGAVAIGLSRALTREREAAERLRELDDLKTTFVAAVSHELRTPLTTIIGFGSVLEGHVDDTEGREFLDLIQRESAHLENLIANLLLASNLEAGVLELRQDEVLVCVMVREAADLVGRLFPQREIDVEVEHGLKMDRADAGCLRQVFINLIQNAAKYSPTETPISVNARRDGGLIRVEVTDQGPGVPVEEREAVFERFRRGSGHGVEGTGIGLFLVRELVSGHGGKVWVEPGVDGVGARFVTELPKTGIVGSAAASAA